eukprot:5061682-Prymnesium_polylepis.1
MGLDNYLLRKTGEPAQPDGTQPCIARDTLASPSCYGAQKEPVPSLQGSVHAPAHAHHIIPILELVKARRTEGLIVSACGAGS